MIAAQALSNGLRPEDLWLRMDHQTFRKLPRSGGIAFGVYVYLYDFPNVLIPAKVMASQSRCFEAA